ncbi:MAG: hypothetical protein ACR2NP_20070 [Pirellulaceae bacterium]
MEASRGQGDLIRPRIRQAKVVFGAMIAGVILCMLVVIALVSPGFDSQFSMLSLIIFGISALVGIQALIIPRVVVVGAIRQLSPALAKLDPEQKEARDLIITKTMDVWFTAMLIGVAMLEGAAFLNLAVTFIEANAWHLVAAGLFLAMMVVYFPSENRVLAWIEQRLTDLQRG